MMDWIELYSNAVLERDPEKFLSKAEAAQEAISQKLNVVVRGEYAYANPERKALEEAFHSLKVLIQEAKSGYDNAGHCSAR